MSKPRLTYFDFAGSRGEECRIALHLAGIDFDDVRVKSADWPALKASMPFGAMPVLQMPGKPPLAHSNAILVFIGRQHGLHPVDAFEAARHEALMCAVEELRHTITPTLRISDPEQKRVAREALAANELATWGSQVEAPTRRRPVRWRPGASGGRHQAVHGGALADLGNAGSRAHHRARSLPETPAPVPCCRRTSRREGLVGEDGSLRFAERRDRRCVRPWQALRADDHEHRTAGAQASVANVAVGSAVPVRTGGLRRGPSDALFCGAKDRRFGVWPKSNVGASAVLPQTSRANRSPLNCQRASVGKKLR